MGWISFTRNKRYNKVSGGTLRERTVRLEFDRVKLATHYKIEPFSSQIFVMPMQGASVN